MSYPRKRIPPGQCRPSKHQIHQQLLPALCFLVPFRLQTTHTQTSSPLLLSDTNRRSRRHRFMVSESPDLSCITECQDHDLRTLVPQPPRCKGEFRDPFEDKVRERGSKLSTVRLGSETYHRSHTDRGTGLQGEHIPTVGVTLSSGRMRSSWSRI